jgi:hypothetical protein
MRALTLAQEVYFDLVDSMNGNTYTELGYDNKKDFLYEQATKMQEIKAWLTEYAEEQDAKEEA